MKKQRIKDFTIGVVLLLLMLAVSRYLYSEYLIEWHQRISLLDVRTATTSDLKLLWGPIVVHALLIGNVCLLINLFKPISRPYHQSFAAGPFLGLMFGLVVTIFIGAPLGLGVGLASGLASGIATAVNVGLLFGIIIGLISAVVLTFAMEYPK